MFIFSNKKNKKLNWINALILIITIIKMKGPFVQTLCIEKDSYMDAI